MRPQAVAILAVLQDYARHSALDFKRGTYGFHVDAVSQRITELRANGYRIEGGYRGQKVAIYRLLSEPVAYEFVRDEAGLEQGVLAL